MDGPAGLVPGATPEATQAIGTEPKKGVPRSCLVGGLVGGALAAVVVVVIIIAALGGDDLVDPLCAGISCGSCQAGSCVCNQGFNSPGGGASPCVENTCTPLQSNVVGDHFTQLSIIQSDQIILVAILSDQIQQKSRTIYFAE